MAPYEPRVASYHGVMGKTQVTRGTVTLDEETQDRLKDAITARGLVAVARELGVSRETLARAAGGFGLREGGAVLIVARIGRLSATDGAPTAA